MKKFLTFALAAILLACTPAAVLADDAVAEEAAVTVAEPLVLDGMTQVAVTSSDSSLDADVSNFYDAISETKCTITFDAEAEEKIFSVYTATKVPEALAKFAVVLDGEKGSIVTIEVYGTNDSLLLDWTPLAFGMESVEEEYAVFAMADNSTRYAFYRFDFTLELGEYFDLAELALYKVTTDEPEMQYDIGDSVEEGEIPALIPVEEEFELVLTNDPFLAPARKSVKNVSDAPVIAGATEAFLAPAKN